MENWIHISITFIIVISFQFENLHLTVQFTKKITSTLII